MTDIPMPEKWPDDVKRVSDAMNLHAVCGKAWKWVAYALADGSSPDSHTTYDTREEAVLYRRWDRDNYFYLQVQPDGMPPEIADGFIRYARMLHDNGYRLPDPRDFNSASAAGDQDFPVHSSMPLLAVDRRAQILELTKHSRLKKG